MFVPQLQFAVGGSLDVLVEDDLAVAFGRNAPGARVFHAAYRAVDGGLDGAAFEGKVAVVGHHAVFHHQVGGVAKRLRARNLAIHQAQVLGVPAQVFAVEFGVVDSHVLGVPESVFRMDDSVPYFNVLAVLERVIAVLRIILDADVLAVHEEVVGIVDLHVLEFHIAAVPESFLRVGDLDVLQPDAVHLAEHLRGFHPCIGHHEVFRIPQRCPCPFGKEAVPDCETVYVPKRVFPFETAIDSYDVGTLFQCGLSGVDRYVVQLEVMCGEQRTFATEFGMFDLLHILLFQVFMEKTVDFVERDDRQVVV